MADIDTAREQQILNFRNESGYNMYNVTAMRIASGEELKYLNGLAGLRFLGMKACYSAYLTKRCISTDKAEACNGVSSHSDINADRQSQIGLTITVQDHEGIATAEKVSDITTRERLKFRQM